jgi:oxygen-independent coproporphyrinogen-3 oxidase
MGAYGEALDAELAASAERWGPFGTVFVGGGTPSVVGAERLAALVASLARRADLSRCTEFTVEMNPESVDDALAAAVVGAVGAVCPGVLRVSLGAQSFDDVVLHAAGRVHTAQQIAAAVSCLRRSGVRNLSVDLMLGLPGQSLACLVRDVSAALALEPEHLSFYALTVDPATPLGRAGYEPDPDLQTDMYERLVDMIGEKGYIRYEISNAARPGYECRHNLGYWRYHPYAGFGCAAVSFDGESRTTCVSTLEEYCRRGFRYDTEHLDPETRDRERVMLGLRTAEGMPAGEVLQGRFGSTVRDLVARGMLQVCDGRMRIPGDRWYRSNEVMREFF